ncbi:hypothetical protein SCMU_13950 [Sinomonas cyclohexanicum]|uniref:Terminase large subunit gp17-like C-terminal domain-containing protein n=1 Tax=Sinomonas cyclohexanicum TaxID=322009 RepID=A0ABM7PTI3_SINCY|nr:phage terminase large subunit [Corynebacterium cyclohexanicum]BCT75553.1 hypothetical protein SCMU_13950 [Corynebacterium cyclohexanicum]
MSVADFLNAAAGMFETPPALYPTPGALASAQNPGTVQTPALDLIDAALVDAFNTPDARLIINMAPQEGKTQRAAKDFPLWCLTQNPDLRVIIASHNSDLAEDTGKEIRDRITRDNGLGIQVARGSSSVKKWDIAGHRGGVFSVGMLGGSAGHPADVLIIDDPHRNRSDAMSVTMREKIWNAWTADFGARLAPGAPVVVMMTRWHEDDLVGRLLERNAEAGWRVLNIPAQCETDDDILGRSPGEFMVSSRGRTPEQWRLRQLQAGSVNWNAQYQGHPSSAEGGLFKRAWWRLHDTPLHIVQDDGSCHVPGDGLLIQSWDMAFKGTTGSDYVVGQVWLQRGADVYLLDQYRRQATFTESKAALTAMCVKWPQASTVLVEDKANGTAVIDSLKGTVPGIIPVTPHESKEARAAAVSPFVEAGNVHLPLHAAFTDGLIEEAAGFPTATHDDQVDALTQALNRLLLRGGQGSAFLTAWKRTAEQQGITVPNHARNWRDRIPNRTQGRA